MPDGQQFVRFGVFELNLVTGDLRRNGARVKLQEQPRQVLAALLEKPGEVVTKEELRARIWANDTFVDFDRSLATAVNKVRNALGDSATRPRYVETIPRKGYRFVGGTLNGSAASDNSARSETSVPPAQARPWRPVLLVALVVAVIVVGVVIARVSNGTSQPGTLVATPLTADPGYELWPSFSPDGEYLAYAAGDAFGSTLDVYTLHLDSRERLRITSDPRRDYSPAWSPDGRFIGFLRDLDNGRFGVYITSPLGGRERLLAEVTATFVLLYAELHPTLAWTHDSRYLVVADRSPADKGYRLVRVEVTTGRKSNIEGMPLNPGGYFDHGLSVDGAGIVFKSLRMGDLQWASFVDGGNAVGEVRYLTSGDSWISNPAFVGDNVVFSAGDKFLRRLWQVDLHGGVPQTLGALTDTGYHAAISPSGDRLVYAQSDHDFNIWRLDLDGAQRIVNRRSIASSTRYDGNAVFSPDGKSVAFESNRSGFTEVWTCNLTTSDCAAVTNLESFSGTPSWSPDGTRLALDSNVDGDWDVYIADLRGGQPRQIAGGDSTDASPEWSPDGKWIYFTSDRSGDAEVWRAPSSGGEPTQVTRNGGGRPRVSPNGRWVYYKAAGPVLGGRSDRKPANPGALWRVPAEGGNAELVWADMSDGPWMVTTDGVYFGLEEGDRVEIRFKRFDNEETIVAGDLDRRLYHRMDVSSDGRSLLVTQIDRQGSDLMIVDDFR